MQASLHQRPSALQPPTHTTGQRPLPPAALPSCLPHVSPSLPSCNVLRPRWSHRTSAAADQASAVITPDLTLTPPPGGAEIFIFGAIHGDSGGGHIGDFILRERPHTVVVETALNDAHGSVTGNAFTVEDCLRMTPGPGGMPDARTLVIGRLGAQLSEFPDPASTSAWADLVATPQFFSEHLAYVAAFASGARLVHGDRPKTTTYQRMLWCPSIVDLDSAFGMESAGNYHSLVSNMRVPKDSESPSLTERIFITERDAVLLQSLHDASLEAGAGSTVVGVVGESHLLGMKKLWASGEWRHIVANGALDMPDAQGEGEPPEAIGVRRALFDGIIRLTCRVDVSIDISTTLGLPPASAMDAYALTSELYGSSRMLLATLEREQLAEVCQGWRCDMWDVLEPLRAVRPVNGGPGYDHELVLQLRTLNFEIS